MNRILAFAGTKQAGKNTCCNFLHGYQLRSYHIIDHFAITESGELAVDTKVVDAEGNEQQNQGVLDVTRIDADFMEWAIYNMWPFVKHYAFATALKEISMGLFGLTKDQCYGTDQDKNTFTTWRWENMPGVGKKKGRMKAREFLQYFGSDICREINENVWTDTTIEQIEKESPLIAIISDCRFPNEVEAIHSAGGKVIKLTRHQDTKDRHASETALEDWKEWDAVIDNQNLSIQETNIEIIKTLDEWGWLGSEIKQPEPTDNKQLVGGIKKIKE